MTTKKTEEIIFRFRVSAEGFSGSETFSISNDFSDAAYFPKIISCLQKIGGQANSIYMDTCRHPDGYDGFFGKILSRKRGGGFNPIGRFSIKEI